MVKLVFYVPPSHLEYVKTALFASGAGKVGYYEECCWQALGQGQYRPLGGSTPYIGDKGQLEVVDEFLVEMVVDNSRLKEAIIALKQSHPYEEPAYGAWQLLDV